MAPLSGIKEELRNVHRLEVKTTKSGNSANALSQQQQQPLCQWNEIPNHPGDSLLHNFSTWIRRLILIHFW